MNFTDEIIISAIQSGNDRNALNYLYSNLFPKIRKYICDNSGDKDSAFDIFQDSIMVFYKYVKTNKFDSKYDIAGFIFTVSKNLWINKALRDKKMTNIPDYYDKPDTNIDILTHLIEKEREIEIKRIMSMLGEKCEQLLKFSIFHKLRNSEICQKMGFSTENAVKTQKYKCMQKLQAIINESPSIKQTLQEI
jgi:RNA polymerase sigma factor (sigma-70 family)